MHSARNPNNIFRMKIAITQSVHLDVHCTLYNVQAQTSTCRHRSSVKSAVDARTPINSKRARRLLDREQNCKRPNLAIAAMPLFTVLHVFGLSHIFFLSFLRFVKVVIMSKNPLYYMRLPDDSKICVHHGNGGGFTEE